MEELKEEIFKVVSNNYINKRDKFRIIINNSIKELKKLNER